MVNELLSKGARMLESIAERPAAEARLLMCEAARCRLEDLICGKVKITPQSAELFETFVSRRANGEPIAYITGTKEFFGIPFKVAPGVLIPRPDTETLVEFAIDLAPKTVIDICTGSGCIAVAIKANLPGAEVSAADISEAALGCAKENAENAKTEINFSRLDILADIPRGKFDLAVSNPPYIKTEDIETLDADVKNFEPHSALDGGADGLVFYRRISEIVPKFLNPGGTLAFEIGFDQADDVFEIMTSAGFENIGFKCDLAGVRRVIYGNI